MRTVAIAIALLEFHLAVAAGPHLNVLMMISDDLRPELSVYGSANARTPHLEKFARRALRFDRAFTQIAVCAPSRMALLSGRRPDTTQVRGTMLQRLTF